MLLNNNRYNDRSTIAQNVGRLNNLNNNNNNNNNTKDFRFYENNNFSDSIFSKSNMSNQNTLISSVTNSTLASSNSSFTTESNNFENPREKIKELEYSVVDYMHNPRRNSITASIRIGKHFDNNNNYSIHSCKKTSIKNVSKNNIILINNIPYPTQLQFPAKISKKNLNNNVSNNIKNNKNHIHNSIINDKISDSTSIQDISYSDLNNQNLSYDNYDSYDTLLQLIQSYID